MSSAAIFVGSLTPSPVDLGALDPGAVRQHDIDATRFLAGGTLDQITAVANDPEIAVGDGSTVKSTPHGTKTPPAPMEFAPGMIRLYVFNLTGELGRRYTFTVAMSSGHRYREFTFEHVVREK